MGGKLRLLLVILGILLSIINIHLLQLFGHERTPSILPSKASSNRIQLYFLDDVGRQLREAAGPNATKQVSSILSTCEPTSQVELVVSDSSRWWIQSLDANGRPKNIGGDEYYVKYTDQNFVNTTMVAIVTDLKNGKYSLDFVTVNETIAVQNLTGTGTIEVILQFTCGVGALSPPVKDGWRTGGFLNHKVVRASMRGPPYRAFEPPRSRSFWKYDYIALYGDSSTGQLVGQYRANAKKFPKNIHWKKNPRADLCRANLDYHLGLFHTLFDFRLSEHNRTAIVLSSALWDMVWSSVGDDPKFADHLEAVKVFVSTIRSKYHGVDLFWKGPTAVHIHNVDPTNHTDKDALYRATKYVSHSRAKYLNDAQRSLMRSLDVTFLDLFEGSYLNADWNKPGDSIHFRPPFNKKMIDWFYN